jgi:hypothetical protein
MSYRMLYTESFGSVDRYIIKKKTYLTTTTINGSISLSTTIPQAYHSFAKEARSSVTVTSSSSDTQSTDTFTKSNSFNDTHLLASNQL